MSEHALRADIIKQAKAEGYREGIEAAAREAEGFYRPRRYRVSPLDVANAIRALAPNTQETVTASAQPLARNGGEFLSACQRLNDECAR